MNLIRGLSYGKDSHLNPRDMPTTLKRGSKGRVEGYIVKYVCRFIFTLKSASA